MPTTVLESVRGRKIRLTRLDACGHPLEDCETVVSSGFVSVSITGEYVPGLTYEARDIWGNLCISDTDPDELSSALVDITLCNVNPDVLYALTGREPVIVDGDAIGFREGLGRNWGSFAVEVWTKNLTNCGEWGYLLIPYVRNGRLASSVTVENGPLTISTTARAFPSYGWGFGPYGDDPFRAEFTDGDIYGMVVTDVAPPADQDLSMCPERVGA